MEVMGHQRPAAGTETRPPPRGLPMAAPYAARLSAPSNAGEELATATPTSCMPQELPRLRPPHLTLSWHLNVIHLVALHARSAATQPWQHHRQRRICRQQLYGPPPEASSHLSGNMQHEHGHGLRHSSHAAHRLSVERESRGDDAARRRARRGCLHLPASPHALSAPAQTRTTPFISCGLGLSPRGRHLLLRYGRATGIGDLGVTSLSVMLATGSSLVKTVGDVAGA